MKLREVAVELGTKFRAYREFERGGGHMVVLQALRASVCDLL